MKKCILFLLAAFALSGGDLPSQNKYILSGDYSVSIHGAFSIHNWSETIGNVKGELLAVINEDGSADLKAIRITMEVRSIKSDMGSVMDNKTYKALKADADPDITFLLSAPVRLTQVKPGGNIVSIKGDLTLAGVCRPAVMQLTSFKTAQGKMTFNGFQKINMTDYGVKPPSALFGTMKAAPDIRIDFKTDFIIQQK